MLSGADNRRPPSALRQAVVSLFRMTASLKLAVVLIVVLAGVLAWATVLEADKGREYAQWYVYRSHWFLALLALLGINILAATVIRFPWRMRQAGFVITHAGLLVLLIGAVQTFLSGIEGQMAFVEGETSDSILMADRSQIKLEVQSSRGRQLIEFCFFPGPVDWRGDNPLDFGEVDGIGVRVLNFYRHARAEETWVADESGHEGPAIELEVRDSEGQAVGPMWVWANPFGTRPQENQPIFQLVEVPVAAMADDFLEPADKSALQGVLSVYDDDGVHAIAVEENVGKKVPIGDSGASIEITGYFADAMAGGGGRFSSAGTVPKNPMLQLQVYLPGRDEPIPEIAFARNPLVNYALMRGQPCPVRFWYRHPGMPATEGAEFLQTPDEKLYCRVGMGGVAQSLGEVSEGDRIPLGDGFEAVILRHLPHARQEMNYYPVEPARGAQGPEAAALVEITVDGAARQFWLRRGDEQTGFQWLQTPDASLRISFGYERRPLGFSLKLVDFKRGMNPGGMGAASFASDVQLLDEDQGVDRTQEISMNSPLVHGKYTFYQSSYKDLPDGRSASYLSVAYDPGRFSKYLGSLMICVGIFLMFYRKYFHFGRKRPACQPG